MNIITIKPKDYTVLLLSVVGSVLLLCVLTVVAMYKDNSNVQPTLTTMYVTPSGLISADFSNNEVYDYLTPKEFKDITGINVKLDDNSDFMESADQIPVSMYDRNFHQPTSDYQLVLDNKRILIFDGDRYVGHSLWNKCTILDAILEDNE